MGYMAGYVVGYAALLSVTAWAQIQSSNRTTRTTSTSPNGCTGSLGLPQDGEFGATGCDSQNQRPIFLSGKVLFTDGTVPTEPVRIERNCGSSSKLEGYTDRKGRFSFELGRNMEIPDASDGRESQIGANPGNRGSASTSPRGGMDRRLFGCELRAVLAGYRSEPVILNNIHYLDNPDLGSIVMHRIGNVQGLTISATSALAPKDARKAFERGLESESKGKFDEAKAEFEKAVMVYPRYAAAWFELGKLDEQAKNVDAARGRYRRSLEADSKYVQPLERLSMLAFQDQDWQNVQDLSAKLLSLDPLNYPLIYYVNAVANFQLKRFDPAEKSIREAIRLDPANKNARSHYVLGLLLAQKHDYAASLESLRAFLTASPQAADADAIREQVADVEAAAKAAEQQKR